VDIEKPPPSEHPRMIWIDLVKGISILWIVFFHFFNSYANDRFPWFIKGAYFSKFVSACSPHTSLAMLQCRLESLFVLAIDFGYHAVGVFLLLSGLGLTYSLAHFVDPPSGWTGWYRDRLLRLYPMYWVAHLIYLVTPFAWSGEPIDYRFLLSLAGDRFFPPDTLFYYLNAAWWYFGLLIQLYFVFPLLFRMLQKIGPVPFLIVTGLVTLISRYLLLCVFVVSGDYVQGAFFGCRLFEFTLGMVIGLYLRRDRVAFERLLFSTRTLLIGVAIYATGFLTYHSSATYTFSDPMFTTGLFVIVAHFASALGRIRSIASPVARVGFYSYGLYLIHEPLVCYFGRHLRDTNLLTFTLIAWLVIPILAVISIELERTVNAITERILGHSSHEAAKPLEPGQSVL
jgi:peptidoglycan/LPS O-acetylase OafA/YrhL